MSNAPTGAGSSSSAGRYGGGGGGGGRRSRLGSGSPPSRLGGGKHPPLESRGVTAGTAAAGLPGGAQRLGFPAEPTPGALMGAGGSWGWPGGASQATRLTCSTTAASRRGGDRVIKTEEATLFSGFEAIASVPGILILPHELRSPRSRQLHCRGQIAGTVRASGWTPEAEETEDPPQPPFTKAYSAPTRLCALPAH